MPAIPQSQLADYVVKETLRQIRNGQVRLANLGLQTEPEVEVQFQVTVLVQADALPRVTVASQEQTSVSGPKVTEQGSTRADGVSEEQTSTDSSTKANGRINTLEIEYEE